MSHNGLQLIWLLDCWPCLLFQNFLHDDNADQTEPPLAQQEDLAEEVCYPHCAATLIVQIPNCAEDLIVQPPSSCAALLYRHPLVHTSPCVATLSLCRQCQKPLILCSVTVQKPSHCATSVLSPKVQPQVTVQASCLIFLLYCAGSLLAKLFFFRCRYPTCDSHRYFTGAFFFLFCVFHWIPKWYYVY